MKHLLNDISEEEKNRIREQHTGGMKIATDKFKKLVETNLGDVKPLISEADDSSWTALEVTFGKSLGKDNSGGVRHKVGNDLYTFYNNGRYFNQTTQKKGNWESDWNDVIIDGKKYVGKTNTNTAVPAPTMDEIKTGKKLLKQGMSGKIVTEIQNMLKKLGFFSVTPTTYFGPKTKAAVIAFQKSKKLNPDGIVGRDTIGILLNPQPNPIDDIQGKKLEPVDYTSPKLEPKPPLQITYKEGVYGKPLISEQLDDENDFIPYQPEPTQSEPTESFWKPYFDDLTNSLDFYFNNIEGPVDIKRFNSKLNNAFYQMRNDAGLDAPINDEYQELFNEFRSHFHNKLKELNGKYGSK